MARVRKPLKKIVNPHERMVVYEKLKSDLIKEVQELVAMSGVEVGIVSFSPTGQMTTYASKGRVEEMFLRYFELPPEKRGGRVKDEREIVEKLKCIMMENEMFDLWLKKKALLDELALLNKNILTAQETLRLYMAEPYTPANLQVAEAQREVMDAALQRVRLLKAELQNLQNVSEQAEEFEVHEEDNEVDDWTSEQSDDSNHTEQKDNEDPNEITSKQCYVPTFQGPYTIPVDPMDKQPVELDRLGLNFKDEKTAMSGFEEIRRLPTVVKGGPEEDEANRMLSVPPNVANEEHCKDGANSAT